MKPSANPIQITAALAACGQDIYLSAHARQRIYERSTLSPSRVREAIAARRAVILPFRADRHRSYHLFFDPVLTDFRVGVVAIDAKPRSRSNASIVTVLTRHQFENDAGPISVRALRTAASRTLDPVAFRRWETEFGEAIPPNWPRVIAYFRRENGSVGHEVLRNPPVCASFVEEHGIGSAAGHPGFFGWLARRLQQARVPVESVVALRIAATDKVRLELAVTPIACPCCARNHSH